MDLLFPYGTPAHWVGAGGFAITIWLGAFLAANAPRTFPARLSILSLFALSGYFLHVVLCLFLPAEEAGHLWRRNMGWLVLVPLPLWLHLITSLLPPAQKLRQMTAIRLTYIVCGVLSALWVFGGWTFSRETLLPLEFVWPVMLFVFLVGAWALLNVRQLCRIANTTFLRRRYILLGIVVFLLALGPLYWSIVVSGLRVTWDPSTRLALGDSLLLLAVLALAYGVAFQNVFMVGHWMRRDFFFHAATVLSIVVCYLLAMIGTWRLAEMLGLDVPTLVLIVVVGLAILTHLLAPLARRWWGGLFFRQPRAAPAAWGSAAGDINLSARLLEEQMLALVNRLQELSGAATTCIALREDNRLIVRASTDPRWIGNALPLSSSLIGVTPMIGPQIVNHIDDASDAELRNCLVWAEPIQVNKSIVGYLLLGDRDTGKGYGNDEQESAWVSTLAAYLGAMLEQVRWRTITEQRIAELSAEAKVLAVQEQSLNRDFVAVLSGPSCQVNRGELREAVYAFSHPERLKDILSRSESTLAALPMIADSEIQVHALRQILMVALDSLKPLGNLPSLEVLRERPIRNKRRGHIPKSIANYYTLRLVMAGHSHETIAEMLDISPRQVRNYLNRALGAVKVFLEQQLAVRDVKIA